MQSTCVGVSILATSALLYRLFTYTSLSEYDGHEGVRITTGMRASSSSILLSHREQSYLQSSVLASSWPRRPE